MSQPDGEVQDGVYLVRVDQVRYDRPRQKPFYSIHFAIVEPAGLAGRVLTGRLCCMRLRAASVVCAYGPPLLYAQGLVEAQLVLARFRVRRGTVRSRGDR